jgi:hypothetical protein
MASVDKDYRSRFKDFQVLEKSRDVFVEVPALSRFTSECYLIHAFL